MSVTEEFLDKIRAIDGMKNAIVSNIEIYGRRKIVCFYLVTDLTYSQNVIPQAEQIAASFLPQGFSAAVKIEKKTPDETLLRQEIMRFMKSRFPAASAFLEERYIEVEKTEGGAIFRFVLAAGEQALFTADNILDEVAKHLRSTFCGSFFGDVRVTEKEREALEEEVIEEADAPKIRIFPIENYEKLDGGTAAEIRHVYCGLQCGKRGRGNLRETRFHSSERIEKRADVLFCGNRRSYGADPRRVFPEKSNGGKDCGVTARYEYRLRGRFRGV